MARAISLSEYKKSTFLLESNIVMKVDVLFLWTGGEWTEVLVVQDIVSLKNAVCVIITAHDKVKEYLNTVDLLSGSPNIGSIQTT
jgi:hypothetical protein